MYGSTISFAYFEGFFLKVPNFSSGGGVTSPYGILPPYIQKLHSILLLLLQINILNFRMIGLKYFTLGKIAQNFILYQWVKEIKISKFSKKTTAEFLERYAPKSNQNEFILKCNLI